MEPGPTKPSLKPKPVFILGGEPRSPANIPASQGSRATPSDVTMDDDMGDPVYGMLPGSESSKMSTNQEGASYLPGSQSQSSSQVDTSDVGQLASSGDEELLYDDVIVPGSQSEGGTHENNSNNKSGIGTDDQDVYDDVILPGVTTGDRWRPPAGVDNNANMDGALTGTAKSHKNRPTNLDMPPLFKDAKDTVVKVATIVETVKQPEAATYEKVLSYATDNKTQVHQPRFSSELAKRRDEAADEEQTIYEVQYPGNGFHGSRAPHGGEDSSESGWHSNEIYEGYSSEECGQSSPRLSAHFDSLQRGCENQGLYEELHFDEGEQGFFIDDDLLYEDLLGPSEEDEDEPFVEDSDSSWGSEEWDCYSDESDSEMVHSYVIEPNSPLPKRSSLDNKALTRQRSLVTTYGMDRKEEEKPQSYLDWVKEFKGRSNLDKVRNFLFGRHAGPKEEEKEDMDEDKDDIHYIDVKLSQIKHPPPALPPQPKGLTSEDVVRRLVVQSIIDSERSYMLSLQRLIQAYEKPLLDSHPPLLEKEKVRMIFYRVRGIYQCHLMFQIALSSRVKNWDSSNQIGDVFVASFSKAMVLDVYSAYVNNFTNAMEVAKRAAIQKPAFRNFIETRQNSSSDRLSLYALMLKPIQRFPQFICLLQDLLKRTPGGHADRMPLQLALTKLETLASVLNERKRQSEQRYAVKQLMKCLNVKFSTKFKNDRSRWLIRQDDMLQTSETFDSQGEIIKCKERRLFMLNDLLVCTTVISKTLSPGLSPGSDMPKCKHRWSVPLSEVEVIEPSGEGGAEVEVSQEPGKLTITTQQADEHDYTYTGSARQMYQERNDLMHDMAVVKQIGALLSTLKGSYGTLTKEDIEDWAEIIQKLINKKSQEIKQADVSKIQLSLPAVAMEKRVTLVFDAVSSKTKLDWITALETAKLALKSHNNPGWYTSEDSDSAHTEMNYGVPLLMKALPVFTTRQSAKIQCAVLCPLEPAFSRSRRKRAVESEATKNCLWVVSSDNKKSYISIVGFQPPSPKILETFELSELRIQSAECVPGVTRLMGVGGLPGRSFKESVRRSEFCFMKPTVWLGTESGRICIYETTQSDKSQCKVSFKVPRAITSMKYLNNRMFLAQTDGTVIIYVRTDEGEWKVKEPRISELGSHPVTSLLPVQLNMWCGCGNHVHIIDTESEFSQIDFEVHQDETMSVQSMVVAGVGVWVAFQTSDIIRLFHTETLQILQDISLASPIGRMVAGLSSKSQAIFPSIHSVHATSLLACYGSLWVGTSLGVLVNFPLPRLEGVPLVNGPAMVAYHTHSGPVKFMLGLEINRQSDRIHYSSKDDSNEASTPTPTQTPHSTPLEDTPKTPPRTKASAHTANLVTSAMSPMTEYFSLAFDQAEEDDQPSTTDSGACSSNLSEESGRGDIVSKVKEHMDHVSASITSTTSLVLCGGEGHHYLMQEGSEFKGREAELMVWQVSM